MERLLTNGHILLNESVHNCTLKSIILSISKYHSLSLFVDRQTEGHMGHLFLLTNTALYHWFVCTLTDCTAEKKDDLAFCAFVDINNQW